jgi:hypothetical protein
MTMRPAARLVDLAKLPRPNPAVVRLLEGRPPHTLNDKPVRLRAGARAEPRLRGGATLLGGSDMTGYVWALLPGDRALCDFGSGLSVVALVADLVVVE